MKKILGAIVVLALVGGGIYLVIPSPERSACTRLADLCGQKNGTVADLTACIDNVKEFRKLAGDEATKAGLHCIDEAKSCGDATGCIAGAGVRGVGAALKSFFKTLGKDEH